jgi:glycosyltransferase involved in cell wall biosynthesis
MRIGFLIPTSFALDGPGNGVRVQAVRQADALTGLGHEVTLLNPWQHYDLAAFDVVQFFQGGFQTFNADTIALPPHVLRVWAPMIDTNESNRRYRLAAKLGHLHPKIYTIPGVFQDQGRNVGLVVARSSHERERLVEGLGIEGGKVRIVLNGVNPPKPADPARGRQLAGWDEPFVLHVSLYTQGRKNVVNMVRAIAPTGLKLVIAGTASPGDVLDQLNALAKKYPNVKLLGFQTEQDLNSLYAACKVFCLPSDHEGTGLVALEAASHGAAVVITRNGGPPDYFGTLAEYVDPYQPDSIREAVLRAFAAPPSDRLLRHVLDHLTWADSARQLVEAYRAFAHVRAAEPAGAAGAAPRAS